jgi:hypothetical protein
MVRCVQCPKFTRKDHTCHRDPKHPRQIKLADIYRQIQCDGFPNRWKEAWVERARKAQQKSVFKMIGKEQDPMVRSELFMSETKP